MTCHFICSSVAAHGVSFTWALTACGVEAKVNGSRMISPFLAFRKCPSSIASLSESQHILKISHTFCWTPLSFKIWETTAVLLSWWHKRCSVYYAPHTPQKAVWGDLYLRMNLCPQLQLFVLAFQCSEKEKLDGFWDSDHAFPKLLQETFSFSES